MEVVKTGYKQTEVGLIPEDWEILTIKDVSSLISGQHLSPGDINPVKEGFPYFTGPTDFTDDISKVTKWTSSSKKHSVKGSILVTVKGSGVGKLFFQSLEKVSLGRQLMAVFPSKTPSKFIYFYLESQKNRIAELGTGNLIPGISRKDLLNLPIPLPPTLHEQRKIAEALSEVDALIDTLEQLIQKKKAIKQGAMQELLTGRTRLPGFGEGKGYKMTELGELPEDWEVKELGQVVSKYIDYRGRTPLKLGMKWGDGNILALSANNVQHGKINPDIEANYGSKKLYNAWMRNGDCEKGDVLITMEAPLGNIAQIPDNRKYILSQRVLLIRPTKELSKDFLTLTLSNSYFQRQLKTNSTGSTAKGIKRSRLENLIICFPSLPEEQAIIFAFLNDISVEMESIKSLKAKAQALKQGMMQELLTGKTRLV